MNKRETQRRDMQIRLDAHKTQKDRNVMGQFSTPYPLAYDMMLFMRNRIGGVDASFLEPAIGTGVFYSAYREVFNNTNERVLGFEIDPFYYYPTKEFWKDTPIEIRCADFLSQLPDDRFDMIVANPPYVRHHHIDNSSKLRLQDMVLRETGIKISGLAGLYCYFILLSSIWLKKGGLSCWLVPSEFMDVNYGDAVKRYLLQNVDLVRIHRFKASDLQFSDALVSSCIVVFRNNKPTSSIIDFSIGGSINAPENIKSIDRSQLKAKDKWTPLFTDEYKQEEPHVTIGDFFNVKRGIATGDNGFFIVDQDIIDKYEIPQAFLRPILPSPRYIKGDRINSEDGMPIVSRRIYLFSCKHDENTLREQYPKVWDYISLGVEHGVPNGYICSRRTPWYSCEDRDPASIVVPYMGRSETNNRMFRFILNTSMAITTNVYLMLYPKPQYAYYLKDEGLLTEVWRKLNTIPTETLSRNGRFYGGGLRKMEPNELMRTPADAIAALMNSVCTCRQPSLYE